MRSRDYPEAPEPSAASFSESQASAHRFLQALLDRLWIVALCVVLSSLASAIYLRRAPRIYQATTTVQVEAEPQRVVRISQVLQEELRSEVSVNTMVHKLRASPLLNQVLVSNRLEQNRAFLSQFEGPPPDRDAMVARLLGMVQTSLRRDSRLVDIKVSNTDPQLAALIANSIAGGFENTDFEIMSATTKGASSFIQQEADRLKLKLQQEEETLQKMREAVGSVGVQQNESYLLPKLQAAQARLGQARADSLRLKAKFDQIAALTNNLHELLSLPQIAIEPSLAQSRLNLARAETDFAAIALRYKAKHPKYQQSAVQLAQARAALERQALELPDTYRMAYEASLLNLTNTGTEVKQIEADALRLSGEAIQFNMLSRQVESDRALFSSLVLRLAETSVTAGLREGKIRVIEPAMVPRTPISPKVTLILAAGVLAGLIAGILMVAGLQALDRSFQTVEETERYLGLPVLNVIPKLKDIQRTGSRLVSVADSKSAGGEAFRTLRTALSMLGREEDRRTFLFTSATPQEGKTFTSINYAAALAQQGLKTLVVDADLRRPSVELYLTDEEEERPGLTDYLTGRKTLNEIVQTLPEHPNFFWIAAGQTAPNPAELLANDCLRNFLAEALQRFDRIVVDSAPVTAVSDTLTIARSCQTTVVVVRSHFTPRSPVLRTLQLLKQAGATLSGVVLNLEPRHWGPGYYHAGDRYYGKDRAARKPKALRES